MNIVILGAGQVAALLACDSGGLPLRGANTAAANPREWMA